MCDEIKIIPPAFGHVLGTSCVSYQNLFYSQWKGIPSFRKLRPPSENGHVAWKDFPWKFLSIACSWQLSLKTKFMTTAKSTESKPKSSCSYTVVIKCLCDSVFWKLSSFTKYFSSVKIRICYKQHSIETQDFIILVL